jgi:hypothetical protein
MEGNMREAMAAHAALEAFAAARSAANPETAVDVALARYRAFFPLARRHELRDVLAHMLALERLQARALTLDIRTGRFGGAVNDRAYRI